MKKRYRLIGILGFIIFELVAALVAIVPFIYDPYAYKTLWEEFPMALAGFLMLAGGATVFYTRHQSRLIRIIAPIIVTGSLMLTAQLAPVALILLE